MITYKLIMGIIFFIIGCGSLFGYITKNEKMFSKKERIRKVYGEKGGTIFHFGKYVVAPIVIGLIMIISELF